MIRRLVGVAIVGEVLRRVLTAKPARRKAKAANVRRKPVRVRARRARTARASR